MHSPAPDNDVFEHLAGVYSFNHKTMFRGEACPNDTKSFQNGITNGAEWYPLEGGMQDYNYYWTGCMELTLELSCCKYPSRKELSKYWDHNKNALIAFMEESRRGVRGLVVDALGIGIQGAKLKIVGRDFSFRTSRRGEFWRILLPGDYTLQISAVGYNPVERAFSVKSGRATYLEIEMGPRSYN